MTRVSSLAQARQNIQEGIIEAAVISAAAPGQVGVDRQSEKAVTLVCN
tara:strand:+ start:475 stop:618 length:144 start_codon:yes stop_codon:yes gene_type:complete